MNSDIHLALVSASFGFGLCGTFYLSAQALGFDNLRRIEHLFSSIVDTMIAVRIITWDGSEDAHKETSIKKQASSKSGFIWRNVPAILGRLIISIIYLMIFFVVNVIIINGIAGLGLALGWILITFQIGLGIPISTKILVAIVLYVIGLTVLGERPHNAVTRFSRALIALHVQHMRWIESNTREGGKTGILGFFMISVALSCQYVSTFYTQ